MKYDSMNQEEIRACELTEMFWNTKSVEDHSSTWSKTISYEEWQNHLEILLGSKNERCVGQGLLLLGMVTHELNRDRKFEQGRKLIKLASDLAHDDMSIRILLSCNWMAAIELGEE
jgi:hypothetical protein